MVELFRVDLEIEHGVNKNPKASMIWNFAWEYGHSQGFSKIINRYEEFVELIK